MGFSALDEAINARRQKIRKNTAQASSCDSGGGAEPGRASAELSDVHRDGNISAVRQVVVQLATIDPSTPPHKKARHWGTTRPLLRCVVRCIQQDLYSVHVSAVRACALASYTRIARGLL